MDRDGADRAGGDEEVIRAEQLQACFGDVLPVALHGTGRDVVFRKGFYNASTRTRPCVLHGNGGVDMRRVLAWSSRLPSMSSRGRPA